MVPRQRIERQFPDPNSGVLPLDERGLGDGADPWSRTTIAGASAQRIAIMLSRLGSAPWIRTTNRLLNRESRYRCASADCWKLERNEGIELSSSAWKAA